MDFLLGVAFVLSTSGKIEAPQRGPFNAERVDVHPERGKTRRRRSQWAVTSLHRLDGRCGAPRRGEAQCHNVDRPGQS